MTDIILAFKNKKKLEIELFHVRHETYESALQQEVIPSQGQNLHISAS